MIYFPQPHPDYERLRAEIRELRRAVAELILQYDELRFHIGKNIETEYMLKLGAWEYRVYKEQVECLRLRRKIELAQQYVNRRQAPEWDKIETQIEREYAEYTEKLTQQMQALNQALERRDQKSLAPADAAEVKRLYLLIVKATHPDVAAPDANHEKLFIRAVEAYKNADLPALQAIYALVVSDDDNEEIIFSNDENGIAALTEQKISLIMKRQIDLLTLIENVKFSFPHNQLDLLRDEARVQARVAELESLLTDYQTRRRELEQRVQELSCN